MAHPVDGMCSVMLEVLKHDSSSSSLNPTVDLLPSFIEDSRELQLFRSEKQGNLAKWTGHINTCLNSAKNRLEGVSLLRALVSQCPSNVFQQHCTSWVRLLTQILQSHDPLPILSLAATTLRNILKDAAQIAELSRELANAHIAPIISAALELKTKDPAVLVLSGCIEYFPGPCGTFRTRIENFLVQLMGFRDNTDLAVLAAQCLALLPRVGGGGQGGVKHTEAWSYYCYRVLTTMRGVVNELYVNSEPGNQKESSHTPIEMPAVPIKEPLRTYTLVGQFKVLCACLQTLLRSEFPEIVKVPVNRILSLCYQVLGLNGKMLSKRATLQWTLLAGSLPKLHTETFNVLVSLISSCRANLIPHGHMINKLFMQALGWTMSDQSDDTKQRPYGGLRVTAYNALVIWLEVVGTCSAIETISEKLLEQILFDARPQIQTTKLKITGDKGAAPPHVRSSGQAKQKARATPTESSALSLTGQQRHDPLTNSQVCLAALKALRCLLLSAGARVKPDLHKEVQEFTIPLLLRIQQATFDLTPAPYSSTDCRKALYHVLLACVIAPHPRWPAPLQCAASLFSRGRQDSSLTVASFCTEAAAICQTLVHPRVPSLQNPLSIAQLQPKRAPSPAAYKSWTEAEPRSVGTNGGPWDRMGTAAVDEVSRVIAMNPPVEKDVPIVQTPAGVSPTPHVDDESSEESSDSDEEDDEEMNGEMTSQIKDVNPDTMEIIPDNPGKPSGEDSGDKHETPGDLQTETVLDPVDSSTSNGKAVGHPTSSSNDGNDLPLTASSKRQLARLEEPQAKSKETIGTEAPRKATAKTKRRKTEDEEDNVDMEGDGNKDENEPEESGLTDEMATMISAFVNTMPDED